MFAGSFPILPLQDYYYEIAEEEKPEGIPILHLLSSISVNSSSPLVTTNMMTQDFTNYVTTKMAKG